MYHTCTQVSLKNTSTIHINKYYTYTQILYTYTNIISSHMYYKCTHLPCMHNFLKGLLLRKGTGRKFTEHVARHIIFMNQILMF